MAKSYWVSPNVETLDALRALFEFPLFNPKQRIDATTRVAVHNEEKELVQTRDGIQVVDPDDPRKVMKDGRFFVEGPRNREVWSAVVIVRNGIVIRILHAEE
jgi:hypothetical protein